jgi:transposase
MARGDELIEPPVVLEADWAEVKEPVDLSIVKDSCQDADKSCNPTIHMGGLVCPRLKMWDARRWLSKPTGRESGGGRKEIGFWRGVVEAKNFQINRLEKELEQLKKSLHKERIRYQNRIEELLDEREVYIVQVIQLLQEREGLSREIEQLKGSLNEERIKNIRQIEELKEERDKLAIQVARYFKEGEEIKSGKKRKERKEEVVKRRPGAKEGHEGWYRPRPEVVNEVVEETLTQCPHCGSLEITECKKVTERTVEDIVPVKLKVIRHRQHYYWCRGCKKIVSREKEGIKGGRLGENVIGLAAEFKHRFNLPYRKIAELFDSLCGLKVTGGGLVQAERRNSRKVEEVYEAIIDRIRYSLVVHADETGWKVFGVEIMGWYLWVFCNIEAVYYYIDRHRSSEVVKRMLGEKIAGILITDFYSAYNKIEAKKQKCLVHVLRDIKNYLEEETADREILLQIKEGIEWLIEKGLILQKDAGTATAECIAWQINRQILKERLDGLCELQSEDENAARLIKRLDRFKGEILTFADYPVEYHNNRAERALRPLVVTRKISYGSQTEEGARTTCIMMSILQTCQIRGIDFGQFIRDAITGRVSEKRLIRRLLGNKREEEIEPSRSPP